MLLEKTNWFWKAGLIEKNKKALFVAMIMLILPIMTGCSDETPEVSDIEITQQDSEVYSFANNDSASTERIEEILSDIYEEAVVTNTLGSLDIMRRMVARLGENGYVAVDSWNQIDMVQAEQAIDFCKAVDEKEMDILTLSDTPEHTMLRVLPLDEKCREYNRKYILPVGYWQNNLFLCNWSEDDFGDLDFYDLFDRFYPMIYSQPVPYMSDENLGVGVIYQVPEKLFEDVIGAYFNMDRAKLRSKTAYLSALVAYEYRPRGFYEGQYPDIAYPEVVGYTENEDGTVTLYINAVYPHENMSKEFSHTTVIRPLSEDSYQYVSNEIVLPEGEHDIWWHSNRLTKEECKEVYGENYIVE